MLSIQILFYLSLPLAVVSWYTVQSMAYGMVLLILFIQASTLYSLGKWL